PPWEWTPIGWRGTTRRCAKVASAGCELRGRARLLPSRNEQARQEPRPPARLLGVGEWRVDDLDEGVEGGGGIVPADLDGQLAPLIGAEGQKGDEALAVHALVLLRDPDLAGKLLCPAGESGRGAHVEP